MRCTPFHRTLQIVLAAVLSCLLVASPAAANPICQSLTACLHNHDHTAPQNAHDCCETAPQSRPKVTTCHTAPVAPPINPCRCDIAPTSQSLPVDRAKDVSRTAAPDSVALPASFDKAVDAADLSFLARRAATSHQPSQASGSLVSLKCMLTT